MLLFDGRPQQRRRLWAALDYLWGIFPALASLFILIALWQLAHERLGAMILPAPRAVFQRVGEILSSADRQQVLLTVQRGFSAVLLAVVSGLLLGFAAGLHRTVALLCRPLITLLLAMPPIIWVVLAIFWFGMGSGAVIFTIFIVVLPLMFASAQQGLLSVPVPLKEMLDVYRVPWPRRLRQFYLPHLIRQILPALIVAVGSGLKVTVMAELLGSDDGMGSAIREARAMLDGVTVLAQVVIMVALIMAVEYGLLEPLRRYFIGEHHAKP